LAETDQPPQQPGARTCQEVPPVARRLAGGQSQPAAAMRLRAANRRQDLLRFGWAQEKPLPVGAAKRSVRLEGDRYDGVRGRPEAEADRGRPPRGEGRMPLLLQKGLPGRETESLGHRDFLSKRWSPSSVLVGMPSS